MSAEKREIQLKPDHVSLLRKLKRSRVTNEHKNPSYYGGGSFTIGKGRHVYATGLLDELASLGLIDRQTKELSVKAEILLLLNE